jgi:hypothetical protein
MTTLRALLAAALIVVGFGIAVAKLPPAPPLDDKAKAAAEERRPGRCGGRSRQAAAGTRRKTVAARAIAEQKALGKSVSPQMGPTARLRPQPPEGAEHCQK